MSSSAFKLFVPIAILIFLWLAVFRTRPPAADDTRKPGAQPDHVRLDPSRFLIRPYYSRGTETALALDGGGLPVGEGQVPSVVMGDNILRMVHLTWLHDWTREDCRNTFRNLRDLYASEEGRSLPAVRIYLNPVFADADGEALHRAMLQVFFRSDERHLYKTFAMELGSGSLAATSGAVRARVESMEPLLLDDWDNRLDWLENDIEKTFSIARVQQARNAAITGESHVNQLTSMMAILPPAADQQELASFLRSADASQRLWLHDNPPTR